jgi:hypothetical protein
LTGALDRIAACGHGCAWVERESAPSYGVGGWRRLTGRLTPVTMPALNHRPGTTAMRMITATMLGSTLALACSAVFAADPVPAKPAMTPMQHRQSMDTNKDGMISREEFMTHQEKMWNDMKKTSSGLVDSKTMPMMGDKANCGPGMMQKPKS